MQHSAAHRRGVPRWDSHRTRAGGWNGGGACQLRKRKLEEAEEAKEAKDMLRVELRPSGLRCCRVRRW